MKYPAFLKPGAGIGIVAPSFGITLDPYLTRYNYALHLFKQRGYNITEAASVHRFTHARSNTAIVRAQEFMAMWQRRDVDFIFSAAGGELMCEILPYIDFAELDAGKPKFFMGYSDNTCLTFLLTTVCDIASLYGPNITGFGMEPWDRSLSESYAVITGTLATQNSYDRYQITDISGEPGKALAPYNKTEPVYYTTLDGNDVKIRGRMIGGCIDILTLLCGTPFDQVKAFKERYRDDGIIWYLETCDFTPLMLTRALWQLRQNGWFSDCTGIIFGRPMHDQEVLFDVTFTEAIAASLGDLKLPIVMNMDFGHLPPAFTIINGCVADISVQDHHGSITYHLI